jgi:hypothetical protein
MFNAARRCVMETLQKKDMVQLEGGGPGTICGISMGIAFGAYFFNPLFGLYLTSKAIGACAITATLH